MDTEQTRPCVRSAIESTGGVGTLEPPGEAANAHAAAEREQLLAATLHLVARRGYDAVDLIGIADAAGLSPDRALDHFPDRQSCFLEAYDVVTTAMLDGARQAGHGADARGPAVAAALGYLLRRMAAFPDAARACVVELPRAGRRALDRQDRMLEGLADLLLPPVGSPDGTGPSRVLLGQLLAGGVWESMRVRVVSTGPDGLLDLLPELTDWVLQSGYGGLLDRGPSDANGGPQR